MRKTVFELCSLPGVSGRESAVRAYLQKKLKDAPAVREMRADRMGNLIVELRGKQRAPHKVLFAAHMDEVGGIVTGITDDGYLRFAAVGGIMPEVLFARRVFVNGHVGVIGGKATHQCKGDEKTLCMLILKRICRCHDEPKHKGYPKTEKKIPNLNHLCQPVIKNTLKYCIHLL